jgi:membrane protein required for beta-lactamase induction
VPEPADDQVNDEVRKREEVLRRVAYTGTWRHRSFLFQVAIVVPLLGIAVAVTSAVSGIWLGWVTAACWIAVGVLAWRQWRQLSADDREVHAVRRGKSILIGLAIFLAGTAVFVLGSALR